MVSIWFVWQMNTLLNSILEEDLAALEAAQELGTTLVLQKGYLTYFFQDGEETWLSALEERDRDFRTWLGKARRLSRSGGGRELLDRIETKYRRLSLLRDRVVKHYQDGERERGYRLHLEARKVFQDIQRLTGEYKQTHVLRMERSRATVFSRAAQLRWMSLTGTATAVLIGAVLAFFLLRQVLGPIRALALETDPHRLRAGRMNEVQALRLGVEGLVEEMGQTRSELELRGEHLIQASKLASVGKLAAGVAHSIRNPLTSVKMRLFSLERSLDLSRLQREDFEVIAEEIRHVDSILRNFLEFSRRPKLTMSRLTPSETVDQALDLVRHRLDSGGVEVVLERSGRLDRTLADPEQLKEVLVNLLVNACEALAAAKEEGGPEKGRITITETQSRDPELGRTLVIRIRDNGPGVPPEAADQLATPFFTTKEEGTGLGLSIASRIVTEHGGRLDYEPGGGGGACFVVILPVSPDIS
jgi:signal transduction histidine kinase